YDDDNRASTDKFNNFNMQYIEDYGKFMNDNGTSMDIINNFNMQYNNEEKMTGENQMNVENEDEDAGSMDVESENEDAESTYLLKNQEMQENIRLLATCGVRADTIIEVLQKKNTEKYIHARNKHKVARDAGNTYLELIKRQQKEPSFYINAKFEGIDNHLVIINNYNHSHLVATAVISNETKETFLWVLENLLKATNRLTPKLLFIDADCAMVAAINEVLSYTKHYFCLFHIRKNLEKHFLSKYKEAVFEKHWIDLLQKYPDSVQYLKRQLYPYQEA
ncbi:7941_t:CDS:2, partial [Racocetra fulgida]